MDLKTYDANMLSIHPGLPIFLFISNPPKALSELQQKWTKWENLTKEMKTKEYFSAVLLRTYFSAVLFPDLQVKECRIRYTQLTFFEK